MLAHFFYSWRIEISFTISCKVTGNFQRPTIKREMTVNLYLGRNFLLLKNTETVTPRAL